MKQGLLIYFSIVFFLPIYTKAQADYSFRNPVLVTGTHLQTGAVYQFTDVQKGLNATITITALKGGVTVTAPDAADYGFAEAFQPVLTIPANSEGYAEFKIEFTAVSAEMQSLQQDVPVTFIDADGQSFQNGMLYEHNQAEFFPGSYTQNLEISGLALSNQSGWISIKNSSGFDYPGTDTAGKTGMATVLNQRVTSFKIRLGATNTSSARFDGLKPVVYFKQFKYPGTRVMPNRTTLSFSGLAKANSVELKGNLSASHTYDRIIIERGSNSLAMTAIAEIPISNKGIDAFSFMYADNNASSGVNYYRLRLVNTAQRIIELSNILLIESESKTKTLQPLNTVLSSSSPVLSINAAKTEEAKLMLTDLSGTVICQQTVKLNGGTNNINLGGMQQRSGYAILVVETMTERKNTRVFIK